MKKPDLFIQTYYSPKLPRKPLSLHYPAPYCFVLVCPFLAHSAMQYSYCTNARTQYPQPPDIFTVLTVCGHTPPKLPAFSGSNLRHHRHMHIAIISSYRNLMYYNLFSPICQEFSLFFESLYTFTNKRAISHHKICKMALFRIFIECVLLAKKLI